MLKNAEVPRIACSGVKRAGLVTRRSEERKSSSDYARTDSAARSAARAAATCSGGHLFRTAGVVWETCTVARTNRGQINLHQSRLSDQRPDPRHVDRL